MAEPKAHEPRDIRFRWLWLSALALTISAVVIHVALWGLLRAFEAIAGTAGQAPSRPSPPAHLHQRQETEAIERAGRDRLRGGAPGGMPIDKAIDHVVKRGWTPPRKPAKAAGGRP